MPKRPSRLLVRDGAIGTMRLAGPRADSSPVCAHVPAMDEKAFDTELIASFFRLVAEQGWARVSVVAAACAAALPLDQARARFPGRPAVLLRFGRMADQAALTEPPADGSVRDKLFDLDRKSVV